MPITDFRPQLDHLAGAAWRPTEADEARVAAALGRAADDAAALLRTSFEAAFEAHRVAERLRGARDLHLAPALRVDRAAALAAVDHFATRTRPPRLLSGSARRRRSRVERLNAFLWSRLGAWLERDGAQTLCWDAVLRFIPDPWLPVDRLGRAIERAARASGAYERVTISLELAPPGGARWLRERTLEAWGELRRHLDEGRPRPVDLFAETPAAGPSAPHAVVAYGYELGDGAALTLRVYDPRLGPVERRLRFDLGAAVLAGVEPGAAAPAAVVRGFRCPAYEPARPPAFGVAWLLRLVRLDGLAWRLGRRLALRRLRRAPPAAVPTAPPEPPAPAGALSA